MTHPSPFAHRYGPWALVTGASSGIGAEFCRQLAARGLNIILAARRKDRLTVLAAQLTARHSVETRVVEVDLAQPDFLPVLDVDLDVGLVVSNAGFGTKGRFVDSDLAEMQQMLDVNCRATLILTHAFSKRLVARGRGGILITSSTAAFQGTPFSGHYAATKGYGLQLAEALWHELGEQGVDVLALCPGATDTEGPRRTNTNLSKVPAGMMDVGPVVKEALEGLGKKPVVIPGRVNQLGYLAVRMAPRRAAAAVAGKLMRRVIE